MPKAMQKRWRRDWLESPEACAENHNSFGVNNIDPNVYVYTAYGLTMAKLYWKIKEQGKWNFYPMGNSPMESKAMKLRCECKACRGEA